MTLTLIRWPLYTNLTRFPSRCTRRLKWSFYVNCLGNYRIRDIHTYTHTCNVHTASAAYLEYMYKYSGDKSRVPHNGAYPLYIVGEVPESITSGTRLNFLSFNSADLPALWLTCRPPIQCRPSLHGIVYRPSWHGCYIVVCAVVGHTWLCRVLLACLRERRGYEIENLHARTELVDILSSYFY